MPIRKQVLFLEIVSTEHISRDDLESTLRKALAQKGVTLTRIGSWTVEKAEREGWKPGPEILER